MNEISVDRILLVIDMLLTYYARNYMNLENGYEAISHFTLGECGTFALVLQKIFPNTTLYVTDNQHIISKIGENYYDATGISRESNIHLMNEQDFINYIPYYGSKSWDAKKNEIEELAEVGKYVLNHSYSEAYEHLFGSLTR